MAKHKRRIVQIAALAALHSAWWGELKWFCLPVLSCHSCALSWFACPIGVFVHYSGYHAFPYIALGTVLLIGVLLGRLLCGWVCPFGFVQDLLYKIPSPTFSLPAWTRWTKYVVLLLMVGVLPFFLGEQTRLSFCRFCPASALQVTLPNMIGGGGSRLSATTAAKLGVLVVVLLLAVCSTRSFCQLLCPIGALLAPLNWLSAWRVAPATDACISCHKCDKSCPTSVEPSSRILQGAPPSRRADCVTCHDCQRVCPVRGKERQDGEEGEGESFAGREGGTYSWAIMDPRTHRGDGVSAAGRRSWTRPFAGLLLACSLAGVRTHSAEATPQPVAQEAEGAVGELRIEGESVSRLVLKGEQEVVFDSPGEVERVPVGDYASVAVHLDGGGAKQKYKADAGPLTVTQAGLNVLRAGGPLDNSVKLERRGTLLKLDYELTGVGGEAYEAVSRDHSKKPSFVVTRGDREVHRGTFEYG